MKKTVSIHALMLRINRKLSKENQKLKKVNPNHQRDVQNFGYYYIIDNNNVLAAHYVELEKLARELNCLKPFEVIEEE